ncbi:hypothetical protein N7449_003669 [Penicillium cf. viridicatum]|uniref:Uncharacterized protein n=1 Tax=Penicillium cf. viridicatum TaxID=2972119 RepID=A0A9W9MXD1_9EURO|nr:hypothetical protein N7449_003669 [Penicillium cf. viridicatum]
MIENTEWYKDTAKCSPLKPASTEHLKSLRSDWNLLSELATGQYHKVLIKAVAYGPPTRQRKPAGYFRLSK